MRGAEVGRSSDRVCRVILAAAAGVKEAFAWSETSRILVGREPSYVLDERQMLEAWLEFHRVTLLLKCEGLDDAAGTQRPVRTSLLSLHGLVRHMAEVERNWFQRTLAEDAGAGPLWFSDGIPTVIWLRSMMRVGTPTLASGSRSATRAGISRPSAPLDDTGMRHGEPCSLRWIYVHMIEEYAAAQRPRRPHP